MYTDTTLPRTSRVLLGLRARDAAPPRCVLCGWYLEACLVCKMWSYPGRIVNRKVSYLRPPCRSRSLPSVALRRLRTSRNLLVWSTPDELQCEGEVNTACAVNHSRKVHSFWKSAHSLCNCATCALGGTAFSHPALTNPRPLLYLGPCLALWLHICGLRHRLELMRVNSQLYIGLILSSQGPLEHPSPASKARVDLCRFPCFGFWIDLRNLLSSAPPSTLFLQTG